MSANRQHQERLKQLNNPRAQLAQLRYIPTALKLVWAAARGWTLATLALLVLQGVLPVLTVYLTRTLVNGLVTITSAGLSQATLAPVLLPAILMGLALVATDSLSSLAGFVRTNLAEQVQTHVNGLVQAQAAALDLYFFESSASYDQLHRASIDAIDRPLALLDSLGGILQATITLVAMAGILMAFAWWVPLLLLGGTLPALWVALRSSWLYQKWRLRRTIDQRRLAYYHNWLMADFAAAELRLFDLGRYFTGRYLSLRRQLFQERLALSKKQLAGEFGAVVFGLAAFGLALVWMGWQALKGLANLGDVAMFYQAMSQGQQLMRRLLGGMSDLYRNLTYLEDLFSFLGLKPRLQDPALPAPPPPGLHEHIALTRVTFRYPDSDRTALSDFSLDIPAGGIVAIVGENGAGKSTLLKLLCRFYDPEAGEITWDGVDLRQMTQADLRRRITVLFQRPLPYPETAHDNIAFGDLAACPDRDEIEAAARASAAETFISRLPDGYETVLGKWFGNTDLSMGEWQRLALARAFVRRADLVILDEPTSAMDSWAEAAWMARFRDLVRGRTALIITHRFTTAMQADTIHVMHEGRVIESGTHAELAAQDGRYAQSWRLQMREAQSAPG